MSSIEFQHTWYHCCGWDIDIMKRQKTKRREPKNMTTRLRRCAICISRGINHWLMRGSHKYPTSIAYPENMPMLKRQNVCVPPIQLRFRRTSWGCLCVPRERIGTAPYFRGREVTKIFSNIEVFGYYVIHQLPPMFPHCCLPTFVNAEAIHISVKNLFRLLPE